MTDHSRITVYLRTDQGSFEEVIIDETVTVEHLRYIAEVGKEMLACFRGDDGLFRIPEDRPVIESVDNGKKIRFSPSPHVAGDPRSASTAEPADQKKKVLHLHRTPVAIEEDTTAGDLKALTDARENERLTSWQHGTLRYWEDDDRLYEHVEDGQKLAWRVLDDHPGYPS